MPPVGASFRLFPRLDHWCGGTEGVEQTTVLIELPTVWVQSHVEGYGIRELAFSANPANDAKSFHNAHHNVNVSITSWLSLSK